MVSKTLSNSVVAKIKDTLLHGSSIVFKRALKADLLNI